MPPKRSRDGQSHCGRLHSDQRCSIVREATGLRDASLALIPLEFSERRRVLMLICDRFGIDPTRLGPVNRENEMAIMKLEEALHWLDHRTRDRQTRGVEGTHQV